VTLALVALVGAFTIALTACEGPPRMGHGGVGAGTPGPVGSPVVGREAITTSTIKTPLFTAKFPVLKGLGKVRTANPCNNHGCPFLGTGQSWYSQLFPSNDGRGYCRTDPDEGGKPLPQPCNYTATSPNIYEVDVYPIPADAKHFGVRWAASVFQCQNWQTTVPVGNTRGVKCPTEVHENGNSASYLIVRRGYLIVVDVSDDYYSQKFLNDFRVT
jgi:hypothetical protein